VIRHSSDTREAGEPEGEPGLGEDQGDGVDEEQPDTRAAHNSRTLPRQSI